MHSHSTSGHFQTLHYRNPHYGQFTVDAVVPEANVPAYVSAGGPSGGYYCRTIIMPSKKQAIGKKPVTTKPRQTAVRVYSKQSTRHHGRDIRDLLDIIDIAERSDEL